LKVLEKARNWKRNGKGLDSIIFMIQQDLKTSKTGIIIHGSIDQCSLLFSSISSARIGSKKKK